MKQILLTLLAIMGSVALHAQDFTRYSYYLVSDSIYETKDYTYLERDTTDIYGYIPLTGEDQYIQITDKPVYVVVLDAKLDTAYYLNAYSAVYNYDSTTGERDYWMGNWNPYNYSKEHNMGWSKAKNKDYPYMYLWWTFQNYSAPEEYYSFGGIEPGMYYIRLEKESMIDDDPIILFAKMDELQPLEKDFPCPIAIYYKSTKHTITTGGYSSSYNAVNSPLSAMYFINHGSSKTTTTTYYTWDFWCGILFSDHINDLMFGPGPAHPLDIGPFKGYHYWPYLNEVYKNNQALVMLLPNNGRKTFGFKKTTKYDTRFDTYWYDLVEADLSDLQYNRAPDGVTWYCPEEQPAEPMTMLLDVENKRACFVPTSFYEKHWLSNDYESVKMYADFCFANYTTEGNEALPLKPSEMSEMIETYSKLYNDKEGAKSLHDYAFGDVAKAYQNTHNIIDWFYLHHDPEGWLPAMNAEEINQRIDEYCQYFNDPIGALKLREYASLNDKTWVGDVDSNGKLTPMDVIGLHTYLLGKEKLPQQIKQLDMNGDGKISIVDITLLNKILTGKAEAQKLKP